MHHKRIILLGAREAIGSCYVATQLLTKDCFSHHALFFMLSIALHLQHKIYGDVIEIVLL